MFCCKGCNGLTKIPRWTRCKKRHFFPFFGIITPGDAGTDSCISMSVSRELGIFVLYDWNCNKHGAERFVFCSKTFLFICAQKCTRLQCTKLAWCARRMLQNSQCKHNVQCLSCRTSTLDILYIYFCEKQSDSIQNSCVINRVPK